MKNDDIIIIEHLYKSFGKVEAVVDASLRVKRGEVCFIFGPSGGGKSTLLRCINGLEKPDSGTIIIDGVDVTDKNINIDEVRAEIGMVFQLFNLFPHLTALGNITIAQEKVRKRPKEEAERLAMELLEMVGMPEKADAYPIQLSGGQKQRVAMARALAMNPKIIRRAHKELGYIIETGELSAESEAVWKALDEALGKENNDHHNPGVS